ncbi:unnamed protein product [Medioppia subpectinata]|uniref:Uncharacterized protein n=1 Tax=Medioppia subpectinata TaxID=1979941 RepID=A0A7R9PY33_9ACAR|nr:unnamed protein product [Medioppia subpectinata]CAG2105464.1 unnamed protein product [Medioppia subpectinata]
MSDTNAVQEYKDIIYKNIIKGMQVLIDARIKLDIPWGRPDSEIHAQHVFACDNRQTISQHVFTQYVRPIGHLWTDEGIRHAFERRIEFQLSDGVRYLFDNIDRIGGEDYLPTNQDILYSRKATKGVTEYSVTINKIPFRFVDVGGQRSQRQKWFQCFECVTSILFIVSSSEYDQVLLEDRHKNRLRESQNIFDTIVNNRCFQEVSYILFLNKTDLLEEKLNKARVVLKRVERVDQTHSKTTTTTTTCQSSNGTNANSERQQTIVSAEKSEQTNGQTNGHNNGLNCDYNSNTIDKYFPEFRGDPTDLSTVQSFILQLFECVRRDKRKQLYHHFTTAVDTENIKYVFNDVRNTILQSNITQLMLQ